MANAVAQPTSANVDVTEGQTVINSQDVVGKSLPLTVQGDTKSQKMGSDTWGRLIRLQNTGTPGKFWDIGIDQDGNLFFNAGDKRMLTLPFPNQPGNVNEHP